MSEIMYDRAKGQFPVSIGTSLALEGLFGIHPDIPLKGGKPPPYQEKYYDCICINMSTLTRNLVNSFKTADIPNLKLEHLISDLNNEMKLIKEIVKEHSKERMVCSFYYNDYFDLRKVLKSNNFQKTLTDKQALQHNFEVNVPLGISVSDFNQEITSLYIRQGRRRNVMLTHQPVDLLLCKFAKFDLLESHTGKIKTQTEFNTKLKYANDDTPFNTVTIQVYGDKTGLVLPVESKLRKLFTEEMKNLGISSLTAEPKFLKLMKKSKEAEIRSLVCP